MRQSILSLAAFAVLTAAQPADYNSTSNDWASVLGGSSASCAELAVVFARGTFDVSNIGPWVGGPFRDALYAAIPGVAVQGVDPASYPADLSDYVNDGSPDSCGEWIGSSIQTYASVCSSTKFVISGWSQGALCAHKSLSSLGSAVDQVIALTTFGDPISVWDDSTTVIFPAVPSNVQAFSYCEQSIPDPLCTDPLEDLPDSADALISDLVDAWDAVSEVSMDDDQMDAVASLIVELPTQFLGQVDTLVENIASGDIRRWMLTPEHFFYGLDGTVTQAANDIASAFSG